MDKQEPRGIGGWIVANLVLLGAMTLFVVWAYPTLPARYPVHFDLQGTPNRWASGTSMEWFLVLGIAVFVTATFIGISVSLEKMPIELVNVPYKERFLKLPRDRQIDVLRGFSRMMLAMGLTVNGLMTGVYVMLYEVALGRMAPLSGKPIVAVPTAMVAVLLGWTFQISRQIRRECDEHEARARRGARPGSEH